MVLKPFCGSVGCLQTLFAEYVALEVLLYLFWHINKHQFICDFNFYEKNKCRKCL